MPYGYSWSVFITIYDSKQFIFYLGKDCSIKLMLKDIASYFSNSFLSLKKWSDVWKENLWCFFFFLVLRCIPHKVKQADTTLCVVLYFSPTFKTGTWLMPCYQSAKIKTIISPERESNRQPSYLQTDSVPLLHIFNI